MIRHTAGQIEVAVIGGGPAGAVAALLLARDGHRVTLVDRRVPGTGKTCGHCLHPRSGPLLHSLGLFETVSRAARGRTRCVSIHAPGAPALELPLANKGDDASVTAGGWLVDRRMLDAALLDEARDAGVEVIHPAKATVERVDETRTARVRITGPHAEEQRTADLVLAADGVGSRAAKAMGLGERRHAGPSYGFSFGFNASVCEFPLALGTIAMFIVRGGYLGLVRHDESTVHAGALVNPKRTSAARDPAGFLAGVVACHSILAPIRARLAEPVRHDTFHAMSPMPCLPRRRANEGCALVGDAAGYIEPFTGEGMLWAIESAAILASTIRAHRGWSLTAARQYERDWKRTIGRQQRRCALLARALRHPALISGACRMAAGHASVAARLARPFLASNIMPQERPA